MTKKLILLLTLTLFLACNKNILVYDYTALNSKIDYLRIHYLLTLKNEVAQRYWPGFAKKFLNGEIHYFSTEGKYIIYIKEPPKGFIEPDRKIMGVSIPDSVKICWAPYKKKDPDRANFFMSTSCNNCTEPAKFNHAVTWCSDFDISKKYISDLENTEDWATLVIHEMFHQYQCSLLCACLDTLIKKENFKTENQLKAIYRDTPWFKDSVTKENNILLLALNDKNFIKKAELLKSFFQTRNNRREQYSKISGQDITDAEIFWESFEAGARYMEFSTKLFLKIAGPDRDLAKADSSYESNRSLFTYSISKASGLYELRGNEYFYATGFNLLRLAEQLKLNFKDTLYQETPGFLEGILEKFLNENCRKAEK